jgi:hypothetical protein
MEVNEEGGAGFSTNLPAGHCQDCLMTSSHACLHLLCGCPVSQGLVWEAMEGGLGSHKGSLAACRLDAPYGGKLMRKPEGQWVIIFSCKRLASLILDDPPSLPPILVLPELCLDVKQLDFK